MKKIKLIALVLAAVMLLSMIPMTAGAADERHPIVKDVVEFDGQYTSSDSYFSLGNSLYDKDGNCIFTLGTEDEMIYTLTDHCMITLVSNAGSFDLENLESFEDLEDIEIAFQVFSIDGNEITLKSVFEDNYPLVLPYNGSDYTTVVYIDIVGLLFDPDADLENLSEIPIYGYDILDKYGNVIYSEKGTKVAVHAGNGVFQETVMTSVTESESYVLIVDENGVNRITYDYDMTGITDLGDIMLIDMIIGDNLGGHGVVGIDGKAIVPVKYDDVFVSEEYYVARVMDEETYEYTSSYVYDREGNLVYETDASVTYYNGIVAVVDTYESFEIEGEEFGYYIMNLIDLATGDIIVDAENIYCEGGYIFAESTLKRPFGTSLYTTDGEYIGGKDGWIVCIDEGNYTIILEDADAEKTFRVNSDMEVVEELSYECDYTKSYNNVCVEMTYGDDDRSACLVYKGQKISDDHLMAYDVINMGGCDVFVFANHYDGEPIVATAYIISDDKSPFYDVQEDYWAREYIDICFDAGIMNGTGGGKFSPSGAVSRAQVVTTLWRLAGEPEPEGENKFVDVQNVLWYSTAVTWAAENGITTGVGGDYFAPNRTVTRGEVAAILYRYAEYAGDDVTAKADLSTFADADELSDWNRDAFAWCAAEGIITGKTAGESSPVRLAPSDALTRAEIAAVLCRYGV